jgi:predicted Zn-dependent protease with MMP-like domain
MTHYDTLSETEWAQVETIHDLLDEGEIDEARVALDALLRKRPKQPDLRIVDATIHLEEGEAALALAALRGAERSADPAHFFYLRAAAHYDLVKFEEALADSERALVVHADYGYAWDLLARVKEHLGDPEGAAKAAATAMAIDPEAFPSPLEVPPAEFDQLVEKAVAELPKPIKAKLDEMPVLVQDLPTREMLSEEDPPLTPDLLGLFVGRHIFARASTESPEAPGAIFLFRRNLLRACTDREELAHEVRITVQHEVGHLMGLDEDDLDDWGLA